MSFINPDQFAANMFVADQKENPSLDSISIGTYNEPCYFLRRSSGIIPHKEAIKIINSLRTFYAAHSEKDILEINQHFQDILQDIPFEVS